MTEIPRIRYSILLLLLSSVSTAQPLIEETLRHAISLHQEGKVEEAIPAYRKYLLARPTSLIALSNLGAALAKTGRYQEAITQYRKALQLQPNNPPIEMNLGLAYYKTNQIDLAAATLEKVHKAAPEQPQPKLLLADCWLSMGKNKDVIDLLSGANVEDKAVAYLLGTALVRDKQLDRGQPIIDRILRDGDTAEAHLLLGTTKFNALDYPAALVDLEKAVQLNPNLPDVYAWYGQALLRTGDPARATEAFQKALEANPTDFLANLQLAVLLKEEQKMPQARALLKKAMLMRPADINARYQLATIDLHDGAVETARRQLEQLVKEVPTYTAAHVTLATVYYRLKRKADGDRERGIVQKLNADAQAKQQQGVNVK